MLLPARTASQSRAVLAQSQAAQELAGLLARMWMVLSIAGTAVIAPKWVVAIQLARLNVVASGADFGRLAAAMDLSAGDVLASLRGLPSSPCRLPGEWTRAVERLVLAELDTARHGAESAPV